MSEKGTKLLVIDARMINDSGIGVYIRNLIPLLVIKYRVILVGNTKLIKRIINNSNIKVINFNAKIYSLKEQLLAFKIPKCDLYWSPHINIPFFKIKAKKVIITIHDVNHLVFENNFSILKKKYSKMLYINARNKSDHIITVSKFSKDEIIRELLVDENNISVIYNGVDQKFFNLEVNLDKIEEKYFLFVGNVKPHKNIMSLLKVYDKLPDKIKNEYKLIILGQKDGFITNDSEVLDFINYGLNENVTFTGFIDQKDIYRIYKNAALLIFPSLYEGFGLPLLEAMASRIKIICSEIPSLKEIGQDSVNYFNPRSEIDLMNKIIEVLDNEEAQKFKIEKAYIRAKQFSWQNSSKEHIKIFNDLLKS